MDLEHEACEPLPRRGDDAVAEGPVTLAERGAELAVRGCAPDGDLALARRGRCGLAEEIGGAGQAEESEENESH